MIPICAWFAELKRIDLAPCRREVWRSAYGALLRSPTYYLIALATQLLGQFAITVPLTRLTRGQGIDGPLVDWALPLSVAVLACVVIVWLVRRAASRNIRRALNRRGLPTCVSCGYDLTGNESGCCPECGTTVSRPVR
jgi:hypothetical protein